MTVYPRSWAAVHPGGPVESSGLFRELGVGQYSEPATSGPEMAPRLLKRRGRRPLVLPGPMFGGRRAPRRAPLVSD